MRRPCRLRSPDRNRSRSGDLDLQREVPRAARKRAGDRPPRDGCYRHLGPKGPKSVGCDRPIATGQDLAILHYRAAVRLRCAAPVGCDRLIATGQDPAILTYREAPRAARKRAGDRPPRDGILPLYRRARACPSPLLERAITVRGTGPRTTVSLTFSTRERLFLLLEFTKRQQRTI